jgi:hypothetical protein
MNPQRRDVAIVLLQQQNQLIQLQALVDLLRRRRRRREMRRGRVWVRPWIGRRMELGLFFSPPAGARASAGSSRWPSLIGVSS